MQKIYGYNYVYDYVYNYVYGYVYNYVSDYVLMCSICSELFYGCLHLSLIAFRFMDYHQLYVINVTHTAVV